MKEFAGLQPSADQIEETEDAMARPELRGFRRWSSLGKRANFVVDSPRFVMYLRVPRQELEAFHETYSSLGLGVRVVEYPSRRLRLFMSIHCAGRPLSAEDIHDVLTRHLGVDGRFYLLTTGTRHDENRNWYILAERCGKWYDIKSRVSALHSSLLASEDSLDRRFAEALDTNILDGPPHLLVQDKDGPYLQVAVHFQGNGSSELQEVDTDEHPWQHFLMPVEEAPLSNFRTRNMLSFRPLGLGFEAKE